MFFLKFIDLFRHCSFLCLLGSDADVSVSLYGEIKKNIHVIIPQRNKKTRDPEENAALRVLTGPLLVSYLHNKDMVRVVTGPSSKCMYSIGRPHNLLHLGHTRRIAGKYHMMVTYGQGCLARLGSRGPVAYRPNAH